MRRTLIVPSALLLMLGFALTGLFAPRLSAQESTPTPAVTPIELTPGFVAEVYAAVPSARAEGQTVYTVRFTLQPGADIFPHGHPGTTSLSVAEGTFGWTLLQGKVYVIRGAGSGGTAVEEITEPNTDLILEPGDAIYYEDDVIHTARNAGDDVAIVMGTLVLTAGEPLLMPASMDMGTPAS